MARKSVYVAEPTVREKRLHIIDDEHRHLVIARAEPGEELEIFDGKGNVWDAVVETVGKRETVVTITNNRHINRDPVDVMLALALIRHAAFELALEKAVEIGVTRVIPFTAARSNVAPPRRSDRWMRIIIEAAKQSKRYHLPVLEQTVTFDEVIRKPAASKILFAEHNGGSLKSALAGSPVLYLIGPEGGWTDSELSLAREHGWGLVSLGSGILKAETAAIVGAALIRYELSQ